jgi:hypothetical protein
MPRHPPTTCSRYPWATNLPLASAGREAGWGDLKETERWRRTPKRRLSVMSGRGRISTCWPESGVGAGVENSRRSIASSTPKSSAWNGILNGARCAMSSELFSRMGLRAIESSVSFVRWTAGRSSSGTHRTTEGPRFYEVRACGMSRPTNSRSKSTVSGSATICRCSSPRAESG